MKIVIYLHISGKSSNFVRGMGNIVENNTNNLRSHSTAKPIVRPKGDKNSRERSK